MELENTMFHNQRSKIKKDLLNDDLLTLLGFTPQYKLTSTDPDNLYVTSVLNDLAAKCEQLEKENRQLLGLNNNLTLKNGQLEWVLKQMTSRQEQVDLSLNPSFPDDFMFYGAENELNDHDVQEIIDQLAKEDLEKDKFQYISIGNTAVIRMNDGDRLVTIVTHGFYENENTNALDDEEIL